MEDLIEVTAYGDTQRRYIVGDRDKDWWNQLSKASLSTDWSKLLTSSTFGYPNYTTGAYYSNTSYKVAPSYDLFVTEPAKPAKPKKEKQPGPLAWLKAEVDGVVALGHLDKEYA